VADVVKQENAAGDIAIGVEVEGVFVPVAQIPKARIGHAVERRKDLEQRASENDQIAIDQLEQEFNPPRKTAGSSKTEGGGS